MNLITLKKFLEVIQGCYDKHKDKPECADSIRVEFWMGEEMLHLKRIGQFGVVPDVTITLERDQSQESDSAT